MPEIYEIKGSVLSKDVMSKLSRAIDSVSPNEDLFVIKYNLMGANIEEFLPVFEKGEKGILKALQDAHDVFNKLEALPCPTLAVIDGFALGGGFELALACDYRVCTPNTQLGLPEVKLGIFPGWGGTVRLPRIVGMEDAATWITTGKIFKPSKALERGIIDAVSSEVDYEQFVGLPKRPKLPLNMSIVEREMSYQTIKSQVWPKTKTYPAPRAAVDVMKDAAFLDMDEALKVEMKAFAKIANTDQAKNMVSMFFADQVVKKKGKSDADFLGRIGIVGAGLMGGGIAYQSASRGDLSTYVVDIDRARCDLAFDEALRLASKRKLDLQVAKNVSTGLGYDNLSDASLVIEAVTENVKVKEAVLGNICDVVSDDCIVATNTSSIPIAELAKFVTNPERFVGIHFFSPVHMMPLVEIVRGPQTSDDTIEKVKAYVSKIGKTAIVVNDCVSFLVNRVLMAYLNPATYYLRDGGDVHSLDQRAKDFGWPMGPFELMKNVGLPVAVKVARITAQGYAGKDFVQKPRRVELGHVKAALGHDPYDPSKPFQLPGGCQLGQGKTIEEAVEYTKGQRKSLLDHPTVGKQFNPTPAPEKVFEQMMVAFFNEVDKCIEEGIVETREEARMAFIYGTGYPPFKAFEYKVKEEAEFVPAAM